MSNNWEKWDAEHGSGASSAEKIAESIRSSLGRTDADTKASAREVKSTRSRTGSVISRATDSRSTANFVRKKDLKAPAPVKGEKYAGDSAKTKIRMAEYNRKKKAATALDPVDQHTPKTEITSNPHTYAMAAKSALSASNKTVMHPTVENHQTAIGRHSSAMALATTASQKAQHSTMVDYHKQHVTALSRLKPPSAADRLAASIKAVHAQHKVIAPPAVSHEPGSLEDLANKAESATAHAEQNGGAVAHRDAQKAHELAGSASEAFHKKAATYHKSMASYHDMAASNPHGLIQPSVMEEHVDETQASKFPGGLKGLASQFMDTVSRRRSQKMYDSVPKASETKLTSAQKASVKSYTSSNYVSINGHLRGTEVLPDAKRTAVENHVANIDAAFNKQPGLAHDLITYRGVRNPVSMFGEVGSKVGGEFSDAGYGSTASHAAVTSGFGGNGALIRILHPQGSKLMRPSDVGQFGDAERELLMPRGSRFHVAADRYITTQNGQTKRVIDLVRK